MNVGSVMVASLGFASTGIHDAPVSPRRKTIFDTNVLVFLADWPTEGSATRSRGHSLAELRHGDVRNPVWPMGTTFCMNTLKMLPLGHHRKSKHSVSTPRCGVFLGKRRAQWQELRSSNNTDPGAWPTQIPLAFLPRTVRGIAAQCRREEVPMCPQLRPSLDWLRSVRVGCAQRESAARD